MGDLTREEAQDWLRKLYARADITDEYGDMEDMQPYEEAINMAISALSAEPCEDAVSRNDVIKMLNTMDRYTADKLKLCDTDKEFPHNEVFIVDDVYEGLDLLPPVQPVIPNMTIAADDSYMRNVRRDCGLYE